MEHAWTTQKPNLKWEMQWVTSHRTAGTERSLLVEYRVTAHTVELKKAWTSGLKGVSDYISGKSVITSDPQTKQGMYPYLSTKARCTLCIPTSNGVTLLSTDLPSRRLQVLGVWGDNQREYQRCVQKTDAKSQHVSKGAGITGVYCRY
jgi:hypothetical protein